MALSARSYRRSDDTERTFPSTEFRGHRRSRLQRSPLRFFGPDYLVLKRSIRTLAVGPDEAGVWPGISNPSMTKWTFQFLTLEKMAPSPSSSSSTRKGTTLVRPTSASSPLVNPVTFFPSTSGLPAAVLTWRSTPGAWQTSATGLPPARKDSISLTEFGSSARSHIGPWPPG